MKRLLLVLVVVFLCGCGTRLEEIKLLGIVVNEKNAFAIIETISTPKSKYHIGDKFGRLTIKDIQPNKVIFSNGWSLEQ